MIRTGEAYRDSIRDGREVCVNGERVSDVTRDPQFKPLVDIRARIFDMRQETVTRAIMTVEQNGELNAIGSALPYTQDLDTAQNVGIGDPVAQTPQSCATSVGWSSSAGPRWRTSRSWWST